MAADGPALFSDDTACDVREAYRDAIADGMADEAARRRVLTDFADSLNDPDEAVVVWLALAHTQSKLGRLDDETRRHALAILDSGGDVDRWREVSEKAARSRSTALGRVRHQLEGPQPPRRSIRRPARQVSPFTEGQVLGYRARSGRYFLLRIVTMIDAAAYRAPAIRFLDYAGPEVPTPGELAGVPDVPDWRSIDRVVIGSAREHEKHGIEVVGTIPARAADAGRTDDSSCGWAAVTSWFTARDSELNRLGFSPYLPSSQDA